MQQPWHTQYLSFLASQCWNAPGAKQAILFASLHCVYCGLFGKIAERTCCVQRQVCCLKLAKMWCACTAAVQKSLKWT